MAFQYQQVFLDQSSYPSGLRELPDPPQSIYVAGQLRENISRFPAIAIVGSRKADSEVVAFTKNLAQQLAAAGLCVVSGLALGVDGAAHRGALISEAEFPTLAVLGHGLNHIYPAMHYDLAKEIIAKGGLLISQFPPEEKAFPQNFLIRNRLIAHLAKVVIVIQAAARSGSLVTARYALEVGKDVMVLPGLGFDERWAGSNELIKQGAALFRTVEDVLDYLEIKAPKKEAIKMSHPIVEFLKKGGSVHFDLLKNRFGASEKFHGELLELELEGLIYRLPGNIVAARA